MIACVAFIGPQNNPLHVQGLQGDNTYELKFDYLTFVCLDAVDARLRELSEQGKGNVQQPESDLKDKRFLGLVSVTADYHVYAYVTATMTKVLVMVTTSLMPTSSKITEDVFALCTQLESAYKHAVSNPFYTPGTVIESKRFSDDIKTIVRQRFGLDDNRQGGLATAAVA